MSSSPALSAHATRPCSRPPPLVLDDAALRRDFISPEMEMVHADLPVDGTAADRLAHLVRCDCEAYERIRHVFPEFVPPTTPRA